MKLVCIDRDNCGFYKKITADDDPEIFEHMCPLCFGEALLYTDNHIPLFYEESDENTTKTNNLLATVHNLLSEIFSEKKKDNES